MNAVEIIEKAISASGMDKKDVAAAIGMSPQNFTNKLSRNSFSAEELQNIMSATGHELDIKPTGIIPLRRQGIGPSFRQMVDRVIYDTEKADALCHTEKWNDWFIELYVDKEGRFFAVHYPEWEEAKPFISLIGKDAAKRLYKRYGEGSADHMF
jgi:hypothetical protein